MNIQKAITIVSNALKKAESATYKPYEWTFVTKSGNTHERVIFTMGKLESKYVYTRFIKFLWFRFGEESLTISSSDPAIDLAEWHRLGDIMNNTNVRFGVNG